MINWQFTWGGILINSIWEVQRFV